MRNLYKHACILSDLYHNNPEPEYRHNARYKVIDDTLYVLGTNDAEDLWQGLNLHTDKGLHKGYVEHGSFLPDSGYKQIVGHSLGAAAAYTKLALHNPQMRLISFGMPAATRRRSIRIHDHVRVVHRWDIVQWWPLFGWHHKATQTIKLGSRWPSLLLSNHWMETYVNELFVDCARYEESGDDYLPH